MAELLIRGAYLFDLSKCGTGDIRIRDGVIAEVGAGLDPGAAQVIEGHGEIAIPGLVNAHTHSNQALEKGLCDRYPLDAWMVLASYGGANAELSPRELYVSALVGAMEMIRTGSTSVLDMPRIDLARFEAMSDAVMQAYTDIGMRAAVAASFTDLNFASSLPLALVPGMSDNYRPRRVAPVDEVVAHLTSFIGRWRGRHPRLTPMIGPSSLPRCSTELFEAAVALARRERVGLQTHLMSGKSQVMIAAERYGGSTVGFLERIGCLEDWASFAHSIWLDDEEVGILGASQAVVVHNPVSNLKLGAGVSPVPQLRRAGGRIALGSDGASSQDSQNMFETMKGAAILHRITHEQEDWVLAEDALAMCWDGGAAALRQKLGRIEPGYAGDIVLLSTRSLFRAPKEQLAGQLVHSELGGSVDTVIVAGEVVLSDGRIHGIDEDAIHAEAQDILDRLYAGLPDRMRKFEEVRPLFRELERRVHRTELAFTRFCG